jgi:hypothetical protein
MKKLLLPAEQALVLQLVNENGQEDFEFLAETLRFNKPRLIHILEALQREELVRLTRKAPYPEVSLSRRGKQVIGTIWPEALAAGR